MALILAVEPDRRQAAQLTRLVRGRVGADLVLADTTELALEAVGDRIPDLVLVPALLSPQDDAALATALRVIAAAAHVQTLTIPVFAASVAPKRRSGGMLAKWRRCREEAASPEGCDPAVFAEQIAAYLAEAAAARQALNAAADEHEEHERTLSRTTVEPIGTPPTARAEIETETEQWLDTGGAEDAFVAANEPETLDRQPAPMPLGPEPTQAVELAPEPVADTDSEWQPIVFAELSDPEPLEAETETEVNEPADANSAHLLVAEELDLGAFLAELEEKRQEPEAAAGIEPEPLNRPPIDLDASPINRAAAPIDRAAALNNAEWRALSLAPHRWPALEGVLAELPRAAVRPEAVAEPGAAAVAEVAAVQASEPVREGRSVSRPESGRSEWLDMLDALRQDIEDLRVQRSEAGTPSPASIDPVPAAAARPVDVTPAAPRRKDRKTKNPRPVQDEWGFFDPQQCGFTALLAKLDEISNSGEEADQAGPVLAKPGGARSASM